MLSLLEVFIMPFPKIRFRVSNFFDVGTGRLSRRVVNFHFNRVLVGLKRLDSSGRVEVPEFISSPGVKLFVRVGRKKFKLPEGNAFAGHEALVLGRDGVRSLKWLSRVHAVLVARTAVSGLRGKLSEKKLSEVIENAFIEEQERLERLFPEYKRIVGVTPKNAFEYAEQVRAYATAVSSRIISLITLGWHESRSLPLVSGRRVINRLIESRVNGGFIPRH